MTERRQAEENLRNANEKLTGSLREMERRKSQSVILSEMFDLLQSCSHLTESYDIVSRFCAHLFPSYAGAVYIYNASRNLISRVATWNDPIATGTAFEPEDCWALCRGSLHITEPGRFATPCRHVNDVGRVGHACLPLMAQGTGLGIVYLQFVPVEVIPTIHVGKASEARVDRLEGCLADFAVQLNRESLMRSHGRIPGGGRADPGAIKPTALESAP